MFWRVISCGRNFEASLQLSVDKYRQASHSVDVPGLGLYVVHGLSQARINFRGSDWDHTQGPHHPHGDNRIGLGNRPALIWKLTLRWPSAIFPAGY